ncbi:MAG: hypothetical protein ACKOAY_11390 [Haliscomenobacter sp.]
MKKDIPLIKVEDVAVAIVPKGDVQDEFWDSWIINLKEETLSNVLITSQGYGEMDGEEVKTSTLRYFFEEIGPLATVLIEPIQRSLFSITNEYWISFSIDGYLYDKRFVFVNGSISETHFTPIPFLGAKGVMIR